MLFRSTHQSLCLAPRPPSPLPPSVFFPLPPLLLQASSCMHMPVLPRPCTPILPPPPRWQSTCPPHLACSQARGVPLLLLPLLLLYHQRYGNNWRCSAGLRLHAYKCVLLFGVSDLFFFYFLYIDNIVYCKAGIISVAYCVASHSVLCVISRHAALTCHLLSLFCC